MCQIKILTPIHLVKLIVTLQKMALNYGKKH